MFRKLPFALWATSLVLLVACDRKYDPVPDHLYEVFPTRDGQTRVYSVIDTTYNTSAGELGLAYFKKEKTNGFETDLLGRTVTRLDNYTSPLLFDSLGNPLFDWDFDVVCTLYKDDRYAERTDGNNRFLALKIPPVVGASWNGNQFNSIGQQTYRVLNQDTTITVSAGTFEHCVWVEEIPFREDGTKTGGNFYIQEYAYTAYAPFVGKVLRYYKHYLQPGNNTIDPDSRVLFEELIDYN